MSLYRDTFHNDVDLSPAVIKNGVEKGEFFVLCSPDQDGITPIGVAIFADISRALDKPYVLLDYFFINPDKRGKGIGTDFFDSIVKYLNKNSKYECIFLECVEKLVGFYSRLGAIKTSLQPSLCLESMSDLSKISIDTLPERLLFLMAVPLCRMTSKSSPINDLSTLESIICFARTHVHSMTRSSWKAYLNSGKSIAYRVWSRR
jgi:GNAT superfamily N-acetyltransferase